MNKKIIFLVIIVSILGSIYLIYNYQRSKTLKDSTSFLSSSKNAKLTNDFEGAKISRDELERGCPRQDCIPSIDNPEFESVLEADSWLDDNDRVFGVEHKGVKRAYAQRIMNWHEIVNDEIGGDFIAVTFCPLCGSAVAFERKVNGEVSEFGVSGFLHNNDLVMYDRNEGNLWQQITGEAIVGPAARRNELLEVITITTTSWDNWKTEHPDSEVLSIPKGFIRDYDRYPYGTYEEDGEIYFGLENSDDRLHPKEVVYGIIVNDSPKAYSEEKIIEMNKFQDTLGGRTILVERDASGKVTFFDKDSWEEYVPLRGFWFAWAAFNPSTELY